MVATMLLHRHWPNPFYLRDVATVGSILRYGKEEKTNAEVTTPAERIGRSILLIRGEKVILDHDLADLYEVETRVLVQAAKRNLGRFPADFMFQLTKEELENWRS